MKRTPLSRYSPRKVAQLNAEAPTRIALCRRAGGESLTRQVQVYTNGDKLEFTKVECFDGICEECHQPQHRLDPHEKVFRSLMGELSMSNTIMVCKPCHRKLQRSEPMWSRKGVNNGRESLLPLVENPHPRRTDERSDMPPVRSQTSI